MEISLGQELLTEEEGKELYDLRLKTVADLPGEAAEGEEHSAGSLSIYEDSGDADGEIESCHTAADLLCYQAGNVVVVLQRGGIEAQQLGKAIERIAEES